MKAQIRLILSTAALTALIWVYADRASHSSTTIVATVLLAPADPGSSMVLRAIEGQEDNPRAVQVAVTVRGPKRAIERLRDEQSFGRFEPVVEISSDLPLGEYSRNIRSDVASAPELRGLSVDDIAPEIVEFEVDRYRVIPVELKADAGRFATELETLPILHPAKVNARVLESRLGGASSLPALPVLLEEAIPAALEKQQDEADRTLTFRVLLRSPWPQIEATFEPASVEANLMLKARMREERVKVSPLGVLIKCQSIDDFRSFFEQYEIVWKDESGAQFTQAIDVKVPISKVGQLDGADIDAYVTIDDSDLPQESTAVAENGASGTGSEAFPFKQVHFKFPPGFEDVRLVSPPPPVRLRVVRKMAAPELPVP